MQKSLVSVIIINWNGKTHLINCLTSLSKVSYKPVEVILVDNNSKDDSVSSVQKIFPEVKIIRNKNNLGFCIANNIGFKNAKGKYVLFLNNDTIVTKDFLSPLVEKLEEKLQIGIVQPKIIFWGNKKLQSGAAFFTNTGFLYHFGFGKNPDDSKYNQPTRIYNANGACLFAKREAIEKVGLFDEDYFSYFEETDFCHRALLSGYEIWYEPKSIIYHLGMVDNSKHKSSLLVYNSFRNRIYTYLKNLSYKSLIKILPVHLAFCLLSFAAYLVLGKIDSAKAVVRALGYNLFNLNKIVKKRAYIQNKLRKAGDEVFLPVVTRNPRPIYYLRLFTGLEKYED